MFICGGGDGLKQPLQTLVLQLLDRPFCSFILGEFVFDGERSLQDELTAFNRGLATMVWVLEDREDEARPLGMLESHWGFLTNI
jgi:hypothetical protein